MSSLDNSDKDCASEAALPRVDKDDPAYVVDWEGPDDAAKPCNWSGAKRWSHIIVVAILGLIP